MNKIILTLLCLIPATSAFAIWTPLILATDFDGMKLDVLTAAAGIIGIVLVIIGLSWLVRAFVK